VVGTGRSPLVLSALQPGDLARAAHVLRSGGVVALPFNGIFALFGDADRPAIHERIYAMKCRPADKRIALTTLPEHAHELVDFSRTGAPGHRILELWQDLHALGLILPASARACDLLGRVQSFDGTALLVWTEYAPLRRVLEELRALGGTTLFGTSANRSGQPTATTVRDVWRTFSSDLDAIVADDFSHLPIERRQSTTIVDLTTLQPRLHRLGNVALPELQNALARNGFGALQVGGGYGSMRRRKPTMMSPIDPMPTRGTRHCVAFGMGG